MFSDDYQMWKVNWAARSKNLEERRLGSLTPNGAGLILTSSNVELPLPQITWTRTQSPSRGIAPSTHWLWTHAPRPARGNRARSSVARAPLSALTSRRVSHHSETYPRPRSAGGEAVLTGHFLPQCTPTPNCLREPTGAISSWIFPCWAWTPTRAITLLVLSRATPGRPTHTTLRFQTFSLW